MPITGSLTRREAWRMQRTVLGGWRAVQRALGGHRDHLLSCRVQLWMQKPPQLAAFREDGLGAPVVAFKGWTGNASPLSAPM